MIAPPTANDDVRDLWKKVAECVEVINAIQNLKVIVEGKVYMTGQLDVGGNSARLSIRENREVGG
jgi:hypothetical protein